MSAPDFGCVPMAKYYPVARSERRHAAELQSRAAHSRMAALL
jgi:hypothetical protein